MSEEELKPCPYCNNTTIELWDEKGEIFYYCEPCGICGPRGKDNIEAKHKWNSLPRKLPWSEKKPTEPEWYWWRPKKNIVPHMVYVVWESTMRPVQKDRMLVLYPNSEIGFAVDERGGEWAGPIPKPEE